MIATGTLPHDAAVELAVVIALDACAAAGTRALVIKGIASHQQGLRATRRVGDVDVLVPPGARDDVADVLRGRGWQIRPEDSDDVTFPRHSITMYHAAWPCDIDVHDRFPGVETRAGKAFEFLWGRRATITAAGRAAMTPDPASHVVLLALHALRSLDRRRHREDLQGLVELVGGASRAQDYAALQTVDAAAALGALGTARPFLERVIPTADAPEWPSVSLEWRIRTLFPDGVGRRCVAVLLGIGPAPVRTLLRAVRADDTTLRKRNVTAGSDRATLRRLRLARLLGAARNLVRFAGSVQRFRAVRSGARYDEFRRGSLDST